MKAIFRRELEGYFFTPVGYVFTGVFLLLSAVFFGAGNLAARDGNMLFLLRNMSYLWMLLSPVLTMRLIAGDKQSGRDQLLRSAPCSTVGIVMGKYFAACSVLLLAILLSLFFPLIVLLYGRLYVPETLVGYLGFAVMGCSFLALDLAVSCCFGNQIAAMAASFGVNLLFWLFDALAASVTGTLSRALTFFSLYQRFTPFTLGQMSYANLLFGLCFISACLFLCVRILDAQKWHE